MKTNLLLLVLFAFSTVAAAADAPRLALWVTYSIGTDADPGKRCTVLPPSSAEVLPTTVPTLTERDVSAWNENNATWTLDPARFANGDNADQLQNHCFILSIDKKLIVRGVVLSAYSARLVEIPTLSMFNQDGKTLVQLASGNHDRNTHLIHTDALDYVLGSHTSSKTKKHNSAETTCDDKGRVILTTSNTGTISEYTYQPQTGKLIQVTSMGLETFFTYDEQGNLTRVENSNGQVIELDYASTTRIQRMVDINPAEKTRRELTFSYNKDGRPTVITLVGTGSIVTEYDEKGEISKAVSDGGAKVALQVMMAFQNLMRVVKAAGVSM